ncbi:hypothetical protein SAMN05444745_11175 [Arthrobacter sp. OV608]|nr:hypothetical protein SAMN05444745_11175 [Arthrobacter sp. OV608]
MSKRRDTTLLSLIDRALGDQERTVRLQTLIVTITCCMVAVGSALAAVLALSGGHLGLSLGLGTLASAWPLWKGLQRAIPGLRKSAVGAK